MGRGARPRTLTLNIDATLLTAHSDKELAAGNYKHGYGFHPLGCWLDETGEALAAVLRPGNAGSNTAEDHFTVLGMALEQIPAADLEREILVRTDIGGCTHAFTSDCRERGSGSRSATSSPRRSARRSWSFPRPRGYKRSTLMGRNARARGSRS